MAALEYVEHYTYDDYRLWEGDWELYRGHPIAMSPAPLRKHQSLASELNYLLREQLDDCPDCEVLGETDYKISDDTVVRPDIVLTCGETNEAYLTKTPQIIVEIISQSTAKRDEGYKFNLYEKEKVPYYIIVYPDDLYAKVYSLRNGKYDKQGDFMNETYNFDNLECTLELDFSKVFQRFRK